MKKTLLGSLILLAFAGNVQATANTETSGKVTFFGKVVENTCKVKTDNRDMSVVLNDVSKLHLANKTNTAMPTPFKITLESCNATTTTNKASKVGVYFYSWENTDKDNEFTLKNKQTGGDWANMVNIQLLEANGVDTIKVVGNDTTDFSFKNTNNSASAPNVNTKHISNSTEINNKNSIDLHFIAQYYAIGTATAGKVQSSVNFQIAYE